MSSTPAALSNLRKALLRWYARHGRDLPWRNDTDAYRVWVREIMLQQTTVAAVRPYFERFTAAFPTVQSLAGANETDVLKLWEGLGYYSRARNLHRAAQRIVSDHAGRLPECAEALRSLPGIGRYTAGAIASFAYGRREPIVEANTLRLYARLIGYADDPRSTAGQDALWTFAGAILPRSRPGQFNQALMDLGATVCTPVDPRCGVCPLRRYCRACELGRQHTIPRPKQRAATIELTEAALIVEKRGRYLLRRRPTGEWWAGLWDFPRISIANADSANAERDLELLRTRLSADLSDATGVSAAIGGLLTELRHTVTHHRIRVLCFEAKCGSGSPPRGPGLAWVTRADLGTLPLTAPARRLVQKLSSGARQTSRIGR